MVRAMLTRPRGQFLSPDSELSLLEPEDQGWNCKLFKILLDLVGFLLDLKEGQNCFLPFMFSGKLGFAA